MFCCPLLVLAASEPPKASSKQLHDAVEENDAEGAVTVVPGKVRLVRSEGSKRHKRKRTRAAAAAADEGGEAAPEAGSTEESHGTKEKSTAVDEAITQAEEAVAKAAAAVFEEKEEATKPAEGGEEAAASAEDAPQGRRSKLRRGRRSRKQRLTSAVVKDAEE